MQMSFLEYNDRAVCDRECKTDPQKSEHIAPTAPYLIWITLSDLKKGKRKNDNVHTFAINKR